MSGNCRSIRSLNPERLAPVRCIAALTLAAALVGCGVTEERLRPGSGKAGSADFLNRESRCWATSGEESEAGQVMHVPALGDWSAAVAASTLEFSQDDCRFHRYTIRYTNKERIARLRIIGPEDFTPALLLRYQAMRHQDGELSQHPDYAVAWVTIDNGLRLVDQIAVDQIADLEAGAGQLAGGDAEGRAVWETTLVLPRTARPYDLAAEVGLHLTTHEAALDPDKRFSTEVPYALQFAEVSPTDLTGPKDVANVVTPEPDDGPHNIHAITTPNPLEISVDGFAALLYSFASPAFLSELALKLSDEESKLRKVELESMCPTPHCTTDDHVSEAYLLFRGHDSWPSGDEEFRFWGGFGVGRAQPRGEAVWKVTWTFEPDNYRPGALQEKQPLEIYRVVAKGVTEKQLVEDYHAVDLRWAYEDDGMAPEFALSY